MVAIIFSVPIAMRDQKLLIAPRFLERAETLPADLRSRLVRILTLLSKDFHHPSLQSKKVKGSRAEIFECRVSKDIRLIFDRVPGAIRCWYVGEHDVALRFAEQTAHDGIPVDDIEVERQDETFTDLERFLAVGEEPRFSELTLSILSQLEG